MNKLKKLSLPSKMVLGIHLLLMLGLVLTYFVTGTVVRRIVYENMTDVIERDKQIFAGDINVWVATATQSVDSLASVIEALPSEVYFEDISTSYVADFDFIGNKFIGFSDGRLINGIGWEPYPGWIVTNQHWYLAAVAAGAREIVITQPYFSHSIGEPAVFIATYLPDLMGVGGVLGIIVPVDILAEMLYAYSFADDGYMLLVDNVGNIVAYNQSGYLPGLGYQTVNLSGMPGGEFMIENITYGGEGIVEFYDFWLGRSFFIQAPIERLGLNLITVVPVAGVEWFITNRTSQVMRAAGVVPLLMFMATLVFIRRLAGRLEGKDVAEERLRTIIDNMPMVSNFRDKDLNILDCNEQAAKLFGLGDKQEYIEKFFQLSPQFQPDGQSSDDKASMLISKAFEEGWVKFEWMHQKPDGEPIPTEVTLIKLDFRGEDCVLAFVRDLREFYKYKETERVFRQRLESMLNSSPNVCALFDEQVNPIEVNEHVVSMFGLPSKNFFTQNFFDLVPRFQPDGELSYKKIKREMRKAVRSGSAYLEWFFQSLRGENIPTELYLKRVEIDGQRFVIVHARDIREFYRYKETELKLRERMQVMLDSSPLACLLTDEQMNVFDINQEAINLFCIDPSEKELMDGFGRFIPELQTDGRNSWEIMLDKLRLAASSGRACFEWIYQTKDGQEIPCEINLEQVMIDNKKLIIQYVRDLRNMKSMDSMVEHLQDIAFTDELTGARSRRYFMDKAREELEKCVEQDQDFSLIILDADHFKLVNDSHGHGTGDEVLKILAARIRSVIKQNTTFARYGGEEFILSFPGVGYEHSMKSAWRIRNNIESYPFIIGDKIIKVTASFGVSCKTHDCTDLHKIIDRADKALYIAKKNGRNTVFGWTQKKPDST